jgi:hypothetical protein
MVVVVAVVVVVRETEWRPYLDRARTNCHKWMLHGPSLPRPNRAHIFTRHTSGRKQQGVLNHAIGTHINDLTVLLWKQCSGIASCEGGVWGKEGCL